jgi:hypothetical protein
MSLILFVSLPPNNLVGDTNFASYSRVLGPLDAMESVCEKLSASATIILDFGVFLIADDLFATVYSWRNFEKSMIADECGRMLRQFPRY